MKIEIDRAPIIDIVLEMIRHIGKNSKGVFINLLNRIVKTESSSCPLNMGTRNLYTRNGIEENSCLSTRSGVEDST